MRRASRRRPSQNASSVDSASPADPSLQTPLQRMLASVGTVSLGRSTAAVATNEAFASLATKPARNLKDWPAAADNSLADPGYAVVWHPGFPSCWSLPSGHLWRTNWSYRFLRRYPDFSSSRPSLRDECHVASHFFCCWTVCGHVGRHVPHGRRDGACC